MPAGPVPGAATALVAALLARCPFPPPGSAVDCAFSGGPDSSALVALAQAGGTTVTAIHVDHGSRPGSAGAATQAAAIADRLGVAFRLVRLDVADGPNLEARARVARRSALPPGVLTGHTADDRVETMLINLLRGSGLSGLSAMGPSPSRPLLGLRSAETADLCAALELDVVDDPTNRLPRFVRNRVRSELLPLMDDIAGRDLVPVLARSADLLAADLDRLVADSADVDPTDARILATTAPALARLALRQWLTAAGVPPDLASVERVLAVARGEIRACEVIGGRRVERHLQRLRIVEIGPVRSTPDDGTRGAS